jgi:spheroidene monooxygenase
VRDRLWVFGQMALARRDLARLGDCSFWKLCGSGIGEGFTPVPNPAVWAILACWPDAASARRNTGTAPVFRRWRAHADASWTLFLAPSASRGKWSGTAPFAPADPLPGPVAALTRARIRSRHLARFWRHQPAVSARIGANPDVLFKIGIGEVPWINQVTFSVWPDAAAMARFARTGPHATAIARVREGHWFAEELYARFTVTGESGSWPGVPVLAPQREAA